MHAALALLVFLLLSSTASASAKTLVGIQGIGPAHLSSDIVTAKRAHLGAIRVQAFWAAIEPDGAGSYDQGELSQLDQTVDRAARSGLKVILFADGTPCWASSAPRKGNCSGSTSSAVYRYPPSDPQTFAAFSKFLVQRYGAKLGAYEVWNEPDHSNELYWAGPDKVAKYVALDKAVYPAVKQVAPKLPVLAGSFVGSNGAWLQAMYTVGIKGFYDGLAVHFYDVPLYALKNTRTIQQHNGDSKPLWLTEFGWSSCYRRGGPSVLLEHACLTTTGQRNATTDVIKAVSRTSWVKAAVVYTMRDESTAYRFGLLDSRGKAKPLLTGLTKLLAKPVRSSLPAPHIRLSVRKGHLVASGTASITDFYNLQVKANGQLRFRATLRTDRFGKFRIVMPTVIPRSGVTATFRSTWSSRTARAHR
ncbi:cellulase family glycosylhydrolase [Conexibacter woesei]|uniref:cellulase family glycosylhydrolase n=1 Tax=Conexibacter woesei TaxID=191495 RepID=UPI0003FC8629|nr:cellulase family glycosylhydrolase [Conexibacter woesei]